MPARTLLLVPHYLHTHMHAHLHTHLVHGTRIDVWDAPVGVCWVTEARPGRPWRHPAVDPLPGPAGTHDSSRYQIQYKKR